MDVCYVDLEVCDRHLTVMTKEIATRVTTRKPRSVRLTIRVSLCIPWHLLSAGPRLVSRFLSTATSTSSQELSINDGMS
jgi:hypothetical protein